MYSKFTVTHRLRVDQMVLEVRDFECEQEDEFELALPHLGFTCASGTTSSNPALWRLPTSDEWIPHRQVGVLPPALPIRFRLPKGRSKSLVCSLPDRQKDDLWSSNEVAAVLRTADAETFKLINTLSKELEESRIGQRTVVAALGKLLTRRVERQLKQRSNKESHTLVNWRMQKIESAIKQVAQGGDFDVEALAEQCRISSKYLLNQFQIATGNTLNEQIWAAKTEQAKVLIEQGEAFSTIAEKLNYSGPSHFTARFSRHTGLTPTEYRRQLCTRTKR